MGVTSSKSKQLKQLFTEQQKQQAARARAALLAATPSKNGKTACLTPSQLRKITGVDATIDYNRIVPGTLSSINRRKKITPRNKRERGSHCTCLRHNRVGLNQQTSTVPAEVEVCGTRFIIPAVEKESVKGSVDATVATNPQGEHAISAPVRPARGQLPKTGSCEDRRALSDDGRQKTPLLWATRCDELLLSCV
eukprot:SAG31_NODE_384_length_16414_cov_7.492308_14_plen_194_part_00